MDTSCVCGGGSCKHHWAGQPSPSPAVPGDQYCQPCRHAPDAPLAANNAPLDAPAKTRLNIYIVNLKEDIKSQQLRLDALVRKGNAISDIEKANKVILEDDILRKRAHLRDLQGPRTAKNRG